VEEKKKGERTGIAQLGGSFRSSFIGRAGYESGGRRTPRGRLGGGVYLCTSSLYGPGLNKPVTWVGGRKNDGKNHKSQFGQYKRKILPIRAMSRHWGVWLVGAGWEGVDAVSKTKQKGGKRKEEAPRKPIPGAMPKPLVEQAHWEEKHMERTGC